MSKFDATENKTIPQFEHEVLEFWQKNNIFEKSVEQRPDDNLYVFYDGPPFISGLPHYGHILGSIAKDVIPRYWTMKGKKVERVWGWDAHGLTVENKVQKELGIKDRRDIEKYGLEKFTQACYEYTSRISSQWKWYVDRIGRWVDIDNAYKTIDQTYMESVMWAFKQLYDKGLIYEGIYTSLFCTTCGTPVSHFEVALDNSYKDVDDPAVTVKFKIATPGEFEGVYILAWTTTPWTLPSNRALVVDAHEDYAVVEVENARYVVATKRTEEVFAGMVYKIVRQVKGNELMGLRYEPLYDFFAATDKEFKVYAYDGMVTMLEGTGVVHSAPGFGEIDTEMGRHVGLTVMLTLNDEGKFEPGTSGENPFEGMFYKTADTPIREDLKKRKLLFKDEKTTHRFPYHDRCDTLLIQRAQNSWFVDVKKLKTDMLKHNERINWVPEYLKHGRFAQGISQAPDWCISRDRFWATPMPVWEANDGERLVISSVAELEELSGQKVTDLHRPYIDEITIKKGDKVFKRRTEVLDSWFEAGSMPFAQIHYPFENGQKFERNFPGDYIVEYISQTRCWFFFMHVLSTALFDRESFKNVITTGVMAGSDGRKMSKTYGNYADPRSILENVGGDGLRLYLMNSSLMLGENANFDEKELKNKVRNVLNPLWNSVKFFVLYAKAHAWDTSQLVASDDILDKWIQIRLNQTIKAVAENLEKYLVPAAVQAAEEFVDDLSRWYVRRSRERITAGDKAALSTLYSVLHGFAKCAAPIIPFMTESIYQGFKEYGGSMLESVHLESYPASVVTTDSAFEILKTMRETRDLVSAALSIRVAQGIGVRQPLSSLVTTSTVHYADLINAEVNVKEVRCIDTFAGFAAKDYILDATKLVALNISVDDNLKYEGLAREMVRAIQDMRKKQGLAVSDLVDVTYPDIPENRETVKRFGGEITKKVLAKNIKPGEKYSVKAVD